jgi:hypothetical protein
MANDVTKYLKNPAKYIKKEELKADGPRRLVIAGTVDGESKYSSEPELCLTFTDGTRVSLRSDTNLRACIRLFGNDADAWVGREVEVYFDPEVLNPRNPLDQGGIRLRQPAAVAPKQPFVSDLEDEAPPF